jgi:hypothetical protein
MTPSEAAIKFADAYCEERDADGNYATLAERNLLYRATNAALDNYRKVRSQQ